MDKKIITISRQFGSAGRSIGKKVAQELGIPYYDKELIKQVAEKTGFSPEFIENIGEYAPSKSIFAYALSFPLGNAGGGTINGMSASDFLWVMQRQVILDLAEKGPCVIVGRCADYILRDRDDCLHTFIHASKESRAERIVRVYGESEKSPEARLDDKDGRRAVNYKHFTGRDWGRCENYHLALDSGALGIDTCVELICKMAQK
jgi:cytidylate kinase